MKSAKRWKTKKAFLLRYAARREAQGGEDDFYGILAAERILRDLFRSLASDLVIIKIILCVVLVPVTKFSVKPWGYFTTTVTGNSHRTNA